jgi:hypothetical protein
VNTPDGDRRKRKKRVLVTYMSNREDVYEPVDLVVSEPWQWRLEKGTELTLVPMVNVRALVVEYL